MSAAAGALALAVVPGALRLVPDSRPLERAAPWNVETAQAVPGALSGDVPPPDDAVPIAPPPAELTGELAPAVPPPRLFSRASAPGGVYALVVGIDDYPGSESDLRSAVADADTIDAALSGFGVPAANRVVLRNGQARKSALVDAIRSLVAVAGPSSAVVVAYAGHVRKVDGDTEAIVAADGALLPDDELAALLAPTQAQRLWLLIAACYAGGFTEALGPGRILTGAADARSLAYESRSINGSYLVHHLVREGWLEGRAGRSVQEAFDYAKARMAEDGSEGTPVQMDYAGGPLVLGSGDPAAGGTSSSGAPSAPPSNPPPQSQPPPPTTTTTQPERQCLAGILCRRG